MTPCTNCGTRRGNVRHKGSGFKNSDGAWIVIVEDSESLCTRCRSERRKSIAGAPSLRSLNAARRDQ